MAHKRPYGELEINFGNRFTKPVIQENTADYFKDLPPHDYYTGAIVVIEENITYSSQTRPSFATKLYQLALVRDIVPTQPNPTRLEHVVFHLNQLSTRDFQGNIILDDPILQIPGNKIKALATPDNPIAQPNTFCLYRDDEYSDWDGFYYSAVLSKPPAGNVNANVAYYAHYTKDRFLKKPILEAAKVPLTAVFKNNPAVSTVVSPETLDFNAVSSALRWYERRRGHYRQLEVNRSVQISQKAQNQGIGGELRSLYDNQPVQLQPLTKAQQLQQDKLQQQQQQNDIQNQMSHFLRQQTIQKKSTKGLTKSSLSQDNITLAPESSTLLTKISYTNSALGHLAHKYLCDTRFWSTQQLPRMVTMSSLHQILTTPNTPFNTIHQIPPSELNPNNLYKRLLSEVQKAQHIQQQQHLQQQQQLRNLAGSTGVLGSATNLTKKAQNAQNTRIKEELLAAAANLQQQQSQQLANTRPATLEIIYAPSVYNIEAIVLKSVLTNDIAQQWWNAQQIQFHRNAPINGVYLLNTIGQGSNQLQNTQNQPSSMNSMGSFGPHNDPNNSNNPNTIPQITQITQNEQNTQNSLAIHQQPLNPQQLAQLQPKGPNAFDRNLITELYTKHQQHGSTLDCYHNNRFGDKTAVLGFTGAAPLHPGAKKTPTRTLWGLFNDISVFKPFRDPRQDRGIWSLHAHSYLNFRHYFDSTSIAMMNKMIAQSYEVTLKVQQTMILARQFNFTKSFTLSCLKEARYIPPHRLAPIVLQHTEQYTTHRVYQLVNHPRVMQQIDFLLSLPTRALNPNITTPLQIPPHLSPLTRKTTPEYEALCQYSREMAKWNQEQRLPEVMRKMKLPPTLPPILQRYLQDPFLVHTPFITPLPMYHPIVPLPNLTTLVNIQVKAPWAFMGTKLEPTNKKYHYISPYMATGGEAKVPQKRSVMNDTIGKSGVVVVNSNNNSMNDNNNTTTITPNQNNINNNPITSSSLSDSRQQQQQQSLGKKNPNETSGTNKQSTTTKKSRRGKLELQIPPKYTPLSVFKYDPTPVIASSGAYCDDL